jgi:hypothetical protein
VRFTRRVERRPGRFVEATPGRRDDPEVDLAALVLGAVADAVVEGPAGPIAPNRLIVSLVGDPAEPHVVDAAAADLAGLVDAAAEEHGWRFEGPVEVGFTFLESTDAPARVDAAVAPGRLPAWAELSRVAGSDILTIHHRRAVVGRSSNADVSLDADTVSRRHALVIRQSGTHWLADLGSANGTYLNGAPVGDPVEIVAGDVLGFGDVAYSFRPSEAQ